MGPGARNTQEGQPLNASVSMMAMVLPGAVPVLALVGIFLAIWGYRAGLLVVGAAWLPRLFLAWLGQGVDGLLADGVAAAWTCLLLLLGWFFERAAARLGLRLFRLDRQVMTGAAVGMVVTLFVGSKGGLGLMLLGAFLGALAGGILASAPPRRALVDSLGALLAMFGGDGIRLLCALTVASAVVGP